MKNNSHYHPKNFKNIVFWAAGFILFLPTIVLPPNFQSLDWTKVILFRIILTILISFFIFKFFYKKDASVLVPKWEISSYVPLLVLVALFFNMVVSTIFSQNMGFSIFGSPARAGGILNLLFFFVFAVVLALFIEKKQWEKLFSVLFVTGILASLLAIFQYFNILKNVFISYEGGSTPSFLGNSTFLAIYMLFLSFLAFVFFIQRQQIKKKVLYGTLSLLFIFTIFITGSRAAYLGLLIGFLYFFLLYPIRGPARADTPQEPVGRTVFAKADPYARRYKLLKITATILLAASVLSIALFNFFPQLGQQYSLLHTISTRVSIDRIAKDIFGTRLSAWEITLKAIKDKPILGWGPENFYIGFEKYYNPLPFATPKLLWDRPHNILLDVAAHSGIFSVALYLLFWITLFWKLHAIKRQQVQGAEHPDVTLRAHGVQAMFIGYLVILFFNFDSFSTYLISFFFVGYSLYLLWLPKEKRTLLPPQSIPLKKPAALALFAASLLFLWFWNLKPLYLNEKLVLAKNLSQSKQCQQALSTANSSNWSKSGVLEPYAALNYADIIAKCTYASPEKEVEYSQKTVSLLKIAAEIQPASSRAWLFMGTFTNVLAAREEDAAKKEGLLAEAMGYLNKALELSPRRQEIFAEIEKNHLIAKDYAAMEAVGKECIAIDPRFGECYWHLGIGQIFLGHQEEGKKNIALALSNNYANPPYKQLAVAYMSQKNWIDALAAYEKIPVYYDQVSPDVIISYHATLAYLYKQAGNYTRAGEEALKVFKLQPDNPETMQFIKLLLEKNPNDTILNSSLAFIYQQPGPQRELRKAIAIYQQLIENDPKNLHYYSEVANMYAELKEYDRAYVQIILILKLFPDQRENVEDFIRKKLLPIHWYNYTHGVGF